MSWPIKKKLQRLLADETGAVIKDPGGVTSVVLVYPNTYGVGMSNLAVHTLYAMLNESPNILCERAFLPDRQDIAEHLRTKTPVLAIERQRPLHEFDVIAFTVSFENDLTNILPIFEMCGIPHRKEDRSGEHPLIIAGGAAVTLNPHALEGIADACLPGEFESCHEELVQILTNDTSKTEKIEKMLKLRGEAKQLGLYGPSCTTIWTPHTEFGAMHLIEVMRGCPMGCAFCAVPGIYGPPKIADYETLSAAIEGGFEHRKKFGLIGADILGHPRFKDIADLILSRGGSFSLSSVRLERITPEVADLLARGGMRSISLGIEAGSERLRHVLRKKFTDERVIAAVKDLAQAGITNIRLYFMIGLPGETDHDIDAIVKLSHRVVDAIRECAPRTQRSSSVELTITPFVPKPHTLLAKETFAGIERITQIQKRLKQLAGKSKDIKLSFDSAHQAAIEHFLSHADADKALAFLEEAHKTSARKAFTQHLNQI